MKVTIPIQIKDLNEPDKAEAFIEVFGRSTYNKTMRELSISNARSKGKQKIDAM